MNEKLGLKTELKRLRFRANLAVRRFKSRTVYNTRCIPDKDQPSVTVFISSWNTVDALKITIASLLKCTDYQNFRVLVADNSSNDGSAEFLRLLSKKKILDIVENETPMLHSFWIDWVLHYVNSEYVVLVDSDVLFLGKDWLSDLIREFQNHPAVGIVSGEVKPMTLGKATDWTTNEIIDTPETPCSWLFAIRRNLVDHVTTSFAFVRSGVNPDTGRPLGYDTGGLFLKDMIEKGYKHIIMPTSYMNKWYHFGSLSWFGSRGTENRAYIEFKQMQIEEIKKMARRFRI